MFLPKKKLIAKPGFVYVDHCFWRDAVDPSRKIFIAVSYLHENCIFVNLTTSNKKTKQFNKTLEIKSTDKCFTDGSTTFKIDTFVEIGKGRIMPNSYYHLKELDKNKSLEIIGYLKCEYLLKIMNLILADKTIRGKYKKIVETDIKKLCS